MAQNADYLKGLDGHYEDRPCNSVKCNGKTTQHFVGIQYQKKELTLGTIEWTLEYDDCCECHFTVTTNINKVVIMKDSA